ncbi:ABC transporter ATP-binding protein [Paracoccus indicus]|uniref:ABC transporter ATP-binding protein n=1 Tax=Paracoccus indicus TaxID=2079229 RepID=UPI001B8C98D4|nr:ABC transporter ATP-binding protein [Paracoccus indicus]
MSFLSVRGLCLSYPAPRRFLRRAAPLRALHDLGFDLAAGERVGLIGASGSGKSSLLRCLLALEAGQSGAIRCQDRPVIAGSALSLRWYRRAVQYVPQDPVASLEPRMTVARIVAEPLARLRVEGDHARRAMEALDGVGLDHRFLGRRPDELSGGQAQRVAIARAIACRPGLLLMDEPVSGLDMTIRAQVVDVLRHLSDLHGTGILMVSHDISVVAGLCDRAMVMDRGHLVEDRPIADLMRDPHHPMTRELLNAAPPIRAVA